MGQNSALMKKQTWPKIRPRINPSGAKVWRVDTRDFDKQRTTFKTKAEAEAHADIKRAERANSGMRAGLITDGMRVELFDCIDLLSPLGASLKEAVEYFIKHARPKGGTRTASQVRADFLAERNGRTAARDIPARPRPHA